MFWGMGNLNLVYIKANIATKLCFDGFFGFLGGKLGSKIVDEGLNKILKQKFFGVV